MPYGYMHVMYRLQRIVWNYDIIFWLLGRNEESVQDYFIKLYSPHKL